jgi:hypothetical protein
MDNLAILEARLLTAFPLRIADGPAAPHDCPECSEIRAQLDGCTWIAIPDAFIEEHEDILPLLSEDARNALLPAWLRQAIRNPWGNVPPCLMVHLQLQPPTVLFTSEQARLILDIAQLVAENWGMDSIDLEQLQAVQATWQSAAA